MSVGGEGVEQTSIGYIIQPIGHCIATCNVPLTEIGTSWGVARQ